MPAAGLAHGRRDGDRRERLHRRPWLRRSSHPSRLRRRSTRRAAPPAGRRDLRRDRRRRRRHRRDRRRDASGERRRPWSTRRGRASRRCWRRARRPPRPRAATAWTSQTERRLLRAIRRLDADQPIELTATFMGAHEVPPEYRGRRSDYVRLVIDEMLPAVAAEGLAEWCDVFCEHGVFTPGESREILEAGQRLGLKARIHADELALSGGAAVAAEVGARSADHLIFVDAPHARRLADRAGDRDAAAGRRVLPQARTLRAGHECSSTTASPWRWRPTSIPAAGSRRRCRLSCRWRASG